MIQACALNGMFVAIGAIVFDRLKGQIKMACFFLRHFGFAIEIYEGQKLRLKMFIV